MGLSMAKKIPLLIISSVGFLKVFLDDSRSLDTNSFMLQ